MKGGREILGEGELLEPLVAFDQRHRAAMRSQHLCIVSRVRLLAPVAVRGEDFGKAERLRGLDATQCGAVLRRGHRVALGTDHAVHHRQHRDRARRVRERGEEARDNPGRQIGAGGVVDQHQFWGIIGQGFERGSHDCGGSHHPFTGRPNGERRAAIMSPPREPR